MKLYSIENIPVGFGEERVFRTSIANHFLFVFVCCVLAAACFWYGYHGKGGLPPYVLYWIGAVAIVTGLIGLSYLKATLRPSNWLVRSYMDRLLIKYRSYLNDHFPKEDLVVVEISLSDIDWIRKTREKMSTASLQKGGESLIFTTYLDLKLHTDDISGLKKTIQNERNQEAPLIGISRTKHKDYPVRVLDTGILRIEWKGIAPGIGEALKTLGQKIRIESELIIRSEKWYKLEGKDLETRILELAEQGKVFESISLVRQKYGYSLAKSKEFIEELMQG